MRTAEIGQPSHFGRLFDAGTDVAWLEACGGDSWRVYERVGFRPAGQRFYIASY